MLEIFISMSGDLDNLTDYDFSVIKSWNLDNDPFAAIKDFSSTKTERRWLAKDQNEVYQNYVSKRNNYILEKDFDNYYKKADKPIDYLRWKYLMLRKAWFIMPLGWTNIANKGGEIADFGCGDGDTVQRLIDFTNRYWIENNINDKKIHITGIDLNSSRIENAKKLVKSNNENITFEFHQGSFVGEKLKFPDQYFNSSLVTGVFEILDDDQFAYALNEITRVTSFGIYIEDLFEKFPGGYPRDTLGKSLYERDFLTKERHVIMSEPFSEESLQDPRKLWPNLLDQNIWAERR